MQKVINKATRKWFDIFHNGKIFINLLLNEILVSVIISPWIINLAKSIDVYQALCFIGFVII